MSERDVMEYDVVTVGAGPAGLSFAHPAQAAQPEHQRLRDRESLARIGAHILSGAVIETRPARRTAAELARQPAADLRAGRQTTNSGSSSKTGGLKLPSCRRSMNNHGNVIVSPRRDVRLAGAAGRSAGRGDLSGLRRRRNAARSTKRRGHAACASATWAWPRTVRTSPATRQASTSSAKITVLGRRRARPSHQALVKQFKLDADSDPQSYSIGIKELWQVPRGRVSARQDRAHAWAGRPTSHTYGGSFLYHLDNDRIALGYVCGLDYSDPNYQPCEAFQQWKNHPHDQAAARRRHDPLRRRARDRHRRLPVACRRSRCPARC